MMVTKFGIQIDTNNFTEEDLEVFCRVLEEIHQKRQKQEQGVANVQQYPSKALMTHCEIFDSTGLLPKDQTSNLNSMNDAINCKGDSPSVYKMESSKLQQEIFKYPEVCRNPPFKQGNIPITYKANDEEFQRLSVKEKAVWFENNKRSHIRNAFNVNRHVVEKSKGTKNYVKRLRDLWETRLNISTYSNESSFSMKNPKEPSTSSNYSCSQEKKQSKEFLKIAPNISRTESNMSQKIFKGRKVKTNPSKISISKTTEAYTTKIINSSRTINFDLNSSEEYSESQSSIEPCSTNSEEYYVKATTRKKKLCRFLNDKSKQESDDAGIVTLHWTSESDTESVPVQTSAPVTTLNHNKTNNICNGLKCWRTCADVLISGGRLNHEFSNSFMESEKTFMHDFYSPNKVKSLYTLTAMSTPTSIQNNVDYDHKEWFKPSNKQIVSKYTHGSCTKCKYNVEDNTFIDQGFETGSNDTQSPIRYKKSDVSIENQNKYYAMCSTPDPGSPRRLQRNLLNSVSPIRAINVNNAKNQSSVNNTSEFWITFGNYTLSLKIHHCLWERLLLLRKAFVQEHTVENMDINFGIDKQIFPLHSKSILLIQELVQRLCSKDNVNNSYYWFSKGNVWLPFKGPVISTARIRRIFTCLQELRQQDEDSNCLTLGIDNYVFFTNHRKQLTNSSKSSDSDYNEL